MTSVRVDGERTRAGLHVLLAGIHQAAALTLKAAVKAAEDSARGTDRWKDRSGDTRASIRGEVLGPRGKVIAGGVSKFLENGTAAHQIVARRARALHFFVNGREMWRRAVQHPGTKPTGFMAEARERGMQAAEYGAEYFVDYAIAHAN